MAEPAYRALALQARCDAVNRVSDPDQARAMIRASIDRIGEQIAASVAFIGPDCRLVVLPEYVLTGHPIGDSVESWTARAAIEAGGPEEEALAAIARDRGIFLAVNAYERDKHFPELYFQGTIVFAPSGDAVLRYRRVNSLFTPTPHDVLDRYLDHYGIEGVFPVADTEIGRLAAVASDEILFPELARCLVLRGAEVLLNPTSEAGTVERNKAVARRARAFENTAYVVCANTAGIAGSPIPGGSTDGGSQIVDFEGRVLVEAGPGESMVAYAEIDLGALRRARRRPGMTNLLARNRLGLYARLYAGAPGLEPNGLGDGTAPDRAWFRDTHRAAIERLIERGVIA